MKRYGICILLSLIMITTAVSGCVGEGDIVDEGDIVGDWYQAESKEVIFNSNGTVLGDLDSENQETGTWSINDNGTLSLQWSGKNASTLWFVVDGDWLFVNNDGFGNCDVLSRVSIDEDSWSSTTEALTLPSICEGLGMDEPTPQ